MTNLKPPAPETYLSAICGHCGKSVTFIPRSFQSRFEYGDQDDKYAVYEALECPNCRRGTVANPVPGNDEPSAQSGKRVKHMYDLAPGELPAPFVEGMPEELSDCWREVLKTGQAGAWTASELMCRKMLMHIAVHQFDADEGEPFTKYIKALDDARFFPSMLQPVLDGIRERGNRATHDIAKSTREQSIKTIRITHHVLRTIYELPHI
jgi:hypothetical protein